MLLIITQSAILSFREMRRQVHTVSAKGTGDQGVLTRKYKLDLGPEGSTTGRRECEERPSGNMGVLGNDRLGPKRRS